MVGAVSGVAVGTEKAMAVTGAKHIPRAVVVNSMDRENANFDKVYGELKETFPGRLLRRLCCCPSWTRAPFVGYTITTTGKSYQFAGKKGEVKEIETSQVMKDRIEELMESLVEAAAGADDELMEKFFEEGTLSEGGHAQGPVQGHCGRRRHPRVLLRGRALPGRFQDLGLHRGRLPLPGGQGRHGG